MVKRILMAVVLAGLLLTGDVWAMCGKCAPTKVEEKEKKTKKKKVEAVTTATSKPKKGQVVVTGTVICTSCSLKKTKRAKSQCSIYSCNYAVKTKNVRSREGKLIKNEVGKLYHILANDNSAGLLQKKYKGKTVIIVGRLYPEERVIEVEFVKLAPEKKVYTSNFRRSYCLHKRKEFQCGRQEVYGLLHRVRLARPRW